MTRKILPILLLSTALLGACDTFSSDDPPLKGERISVLEMQKSLADKAQDGEAEAVAIPESWKNDYWPQAGGYPNHSMQHLSGSTGKLKRIWKTDIGEGSNRRAPLTATPIIIENTLYAIDADSTVSAYNTENGKQKWEVSARPKSEDEAMIAGGLSFSDNMILVTAGYNEVRAISPADGSLIWTQKLPAPSRAAPTAHNGRAFVTTLDNRLLALDIAGGSILWDYSGIAESAGIIGGASPAANTDIVVPVFSSGEISALRLENGSVAWSDSLSYVRGFGGLAEISDIRAMPVIDNGIVYAISFSGKFVAINERTGQRLWQREIGGIQTPWIAGDNIFVLSTENQLIAMSRTNGAVQWVRELPRTSGDDLVILKGPVLFGGRLVVVGSEGRVIEVNPSTGEVIRQWDAGNTIISAPVVAGGTIYFLHKDGTLEAYR
ncbi:MAG: PQQ-binding-like beta-propeller repeat protein [Micavibrio sp.]|nr:PQQ-binding-like beta-propeller repeat protein [Micavibrio sp.]